MPLKGRPPIPFAILFLELRVTSPDLRKRMSFGPCSTVPRGITRTSVCSVRLPRDRKGQH